MYTIDVLISPLDDNSVGPQYNEDGDVIISEEEFMEIKRLKDLKQHYRSGYDELKNLKAEVQYCQKLVDQCRQRLINGKFLAVTCIFP